MLYFFYGNDREKINLKTRGIIDDLLKKKPDASEFKIDTENLGEINIDEYTESQGLFEKKYIVLLDRVLFTGEGAGENLLNKIVDLAKSENIFIAREGEVTKKDLKGIEKHASKVQEINIPEKDKGDAKKGGFNVFDIANKFAVRDSVGAWLTYRSALEGGTEPENISGILFWQVKSLILARDSKTAGEAGLNPFVFSKAKSACTKWKDGELERVASALLEAYHEARGEGVELGLGLERLILKI